MTERRATVLVKMKEQPVHIKKNQVKIKESTALFILLVTKVLLFMPDMSRTMLSLVVVLQCPINIPSSSVNYFHLLLVVAVPVIFIMARSLHPILIPVYEFQDGFLLFEAQKVSYKTVMMFTNVAEAQVRY